MLLVAAYLLDFAALLTQVGIDRPTVNGSLPSVPCDTWSFMRLPCTIYWRPITYWSLLWLWLS